MDRKLAADLGRSTLEILDQGFYISPTGRRVDIAELVQAAVNGVESYPPAAQLPALPLSTYTTTYQVSHETTLSAAQRFTAQGLRPLALVFASARRPGGGFLNGALAQEESLARASGLYACLQNNPMYAFHKLRHDPLYTNYALYLPGVPVLRTDNGELLEQPYLCAMVAAPAPNVRAAHGPRTRKHLRSLLEERIAKILTLGAAHHHDAIILGAWGCGVFGNDPDLVAELFQTALATRFAGLFRMVAFAIYDDSVDQRIIAPFQQRFASSATCTDPLHS